MPDQELECPRCRRRQPVRVNGTQVRCAKCGTFLCRAAQLNAAPGETPRSSSAGDVEAAQAP